MRSAHFLRHVSVHVLAVVQERISSVDYLCHDVGTLHRTGDRHSSDIRGMLAALSDEARNAVEGRTVVRQVTVNATSESCLQKEVS